MDAKCKAACCNDDAFMEMVGQLACAAVTRGMSKVILPDDRWERLLALKDATACIHGGKEVHFVKGYWTDAVCEDFAQAEAMPKSSKGREVAFNALAEKYPWLLVSGGAMVMIDAKGVREAHKRRRQAKA